MGQVALIPANIATVCVESFLYGIFFVLSTVSLYLLIKRYRELGGQFSGGPHPWTPIMTFIVANIALFISNTIHWILVVIRIFMAFVTYPQGPLLFYADIAQPSEVVQSGALIFTAIVNDAMMIYRMWIVWGYSKRVVVIPLCTLVGLTVCGIAVVYQMTRFHLGQNIFITDLGRWLTSNSVFTLCTNLYCTSMIAWRIWRINDTVEGHKSNNLMSVLAIIVESSAIYTIWTIFFLVTYEVGSNLQFLSNQTLSIVAGISFMLVNVRVGMGWEQKPPQTISTFAAAQITSRTLNQSYNLQPMTVCISQAVDCDDDLSKSASQFSSKGMETSV
ncbi:uncharacterized protein FIBRA_08498 [Fibroporia radiculosa]|uniref:Uncharacterized protein n=1 Tax=Fibroporia radiculosa TaxID=599839 RepID=J4H575_9APHY|nr:uncharacterized protein FIBRA_08498 [Fibroporia radiculosa]CCM06249.1 predicted protein [Fibroporia radiculosa]